jgi:hypothetical protein
VLALFHTMGLLEHFWRLFWPLGFILAGIIMLAERAALTMDGPPMPYMGASGTGVPPYPGQPAAQNPAPPTSIVPANSNDFGHDPDGGLS